MSGAPRAYGEVSQAVAFNVSQLRQSLNMSFQQLSDKLALYGSPINPVGLRRLETLQRAVIPDELVALSDILGVTVETLMSADGCKSHRHECLRWLLAESEYESGK